MRIAFILFCLLGIATTFMPWLHIPKSDTDVYGYIGDGIITGFLFFLSMIIYLFQKNKASISKSAKYSIIIMLSIILLISLLKIYDFNFNKDTTGEINFMVSNALAGMKLGIGVYLMAVVSAVLLILISLVAGGEMNSTTIKRRLVPIGIGTIAAILIFWGLKNFPTSESNEAIETTMRKDFSEMQLAFQTNDLDKFMTYMHPVTVKPLGEENFKSAIQGAKKYLDMQGVSIKSVTVDSIIHTEKNLNDIQSIVLNRIVFNRPTGDSTAFQRTLCVSEDGGKRWYYFNTTGQSFQDIKNGFPYINEALKDYIPNN